MELHDHDELHHLAKKKVISSEALDYNAKVFQ
jgi:hypothetical protein